MAVENTSDYSALDRLRAKLRWLYHGESRTAVNYQAAVILIDLAILAFFIASPVIRDRPSFLWVDYSVAALLTLDMVARALASSDFARWLRRVSVWVDIFILVTLLLPDTLANLGFLRILRLWSLSRTGLLWRPFHGYRVEAWRDTAHAVITFVTFLFVITGFVYTSFFRTTAGVAGYVDAMYFTVATITTTGFGDIVLPGVAGKLTSILTMIIGISLFVRLAQAIFRPNKVFFSCPVCALERHDFDAVHCKACGVVLKIPNSDD